MKKILIIFTGGTIASIAENKIIHTDEAKNFELVEMYKSQYSNDIKFDTIEPYFILSENLSGEYLNKLGSAVIENLNKGYDGIIITHGTDTLQYSAAFISLICKEALIPILIVSSNYPLNDIRSNGFENFCSAVKFISENRGQGVFVSYKNKDENLKFYCAENLLDYDAYSDVLRSINSNYYGEYNTNGDFLKNTDFHHNDSKKIVFNAQLNKKSPVIRIKACPGMLYPDLNENIKAIVIDTYHSGTLKTDDGEFFEFVKNAERKNIRIILTGVYEGTVYQSAKKFKNFDNLIFSHYSPIYTYVKAWIVLQNNLDIKDFL